MSWIYLLWLYQLQSSKCPIFWYNGNFSKLASESFSCDPIIIDSFLVLLWQDVTSLLPRLKIRLFSEKLVPFSGKWYFFCVQNLYLGYDPLISWFFVLSGTYFIMHILWEYYGSYIDFINDNKIYLYSLKDITGTGSLKTTYTVCRLGKYVWTIILDPLFPFSLFGLGQVLFSVNFNFFKYKMSVEIATLWRCGDDQ